MSFGGIGWTTIETDGDDGVLFFGGDAPSRAVEAVVRYRGIEHRLPVESGFFVFVRWNVAEDDREEPELVGFT